MFRYFINRLILMVLIMLIVSSVTFFIIRWLPGDPVSLWGGDHPTRDQLDVARENLGFNKPVYKHIFNERYLMYTNGYTASNISGTIGWVIRTVSTYDRNDYNY